MNRFALVFLFLVPLLALSSCAPATGTPREATLQPTAQAVIVVEPTAIPPTPTAVPAPIADSGPVFVWRELDPTRLAYTTADGETVLISENFEATLSPSGSRYAFRSGDTEITVVDRTTQTESAYQLQDIYYVNNLSGWLDDEHILLGVWPTVDFEGPNNGVLVLYDLETETLTTLSDGLTSSAAAISPDKSQLAFDGERAYIYTLESGTAVIFDPTTFAGWPAELGNIARLGSPSWSPDGSQMAWIIGGGFPEMESGWGIATAIFDLEANTVQIFHPYDPVGRGGWPWAAVWSPDGEWFGVEEWPLEQARAGLWLYAVDGSETLHVGPQTSTPIWSADGQTLYHRRWNDTDFWAEAFSLDTRESDVLDAVPTGAMLVGLGEAFAELEQ